jgi:hypothetical protein
MVLSLTNIKAERCSCQIARKEIFELISEMMFAQRQPSSIFLFCLPADIAQIYALIKYLRCKITAGMLMLRLSCT